MDNSEEVFSFMLFRLRLLHIGPLHGLICCPSSCLLKHDPMAIRFEALSSYRTAATTSHSVLLPGGHWSLSLTCNEYCSTCSVATLMAVSHVLLYKQKERSVSFWSVCINLVFCIHEHALPQREILKKNSTRPALHWWFHIVHRHLLQLAK